LNKFDARIIIGNNTIDNKKCLRTGISIVYCFYGLILLIRLFSLILIRYKFVIGIVMAKKENRKVINMQCTDCQRITHHTTKRIKPKSGEEVKRLEIKKYCKYCKKRTAHKETK